MGNNRDITALGATNLDKSCHLSVSWGELHSDFPVHSHANNELVIITSGKGIHIAESLEFEIRTGDTFVLKGNQTHGFVVSRGSLEVVNIGFAPEHFARTFAKLRELSGFNVLFMLEPMYRREYEFNSHLHLRTGQLNHVLGMVHGIQRELSGGMPGYAVMASSLFEQLTVYLSRAYSESIHTAQHALWHVGEIISFIDTCYQKPLSLKELAGMANMSVNNFLRVFKSVVGCAPIEYLIEVRIQHARELLIETDLSINQIAYESGFNDSNYFTRQFRKHAGVSPRGFRKGRF